MRHAWDTVHHDFKWNRDLLLHFFGGSPWPLGDDLNIVVCHVRVRFNRKLVEGNGTPQEQENRHRQHNKAVVESKIDKTSDHRLFLLLMWSLLRHSFRGVLHD